MKIFLSATLALLLLGCSNEESSSSKEEVQQSVQKATKIVKKEIETTTKKVVKESDEVVKKIPKPVVVKIDGAKLFTKCTSCHGQNAEKKALNKSNIIKGWSTDKTITAINGYRDGSYGSSMKGVMKPQVAKLTKTEIQALAEYISKL